MTELPLCIWPDPTDEIMAVLRAAKATIDTDVLVRPKLAVPGGPAPVLAFGALPDFATDVIFIREESTNDVERVAAALRHWLNGGAPTYTMADMLSIWMGCRVEEVIDELRLGEIEYALDRQKAMRR